MAYDPSEPINLGVGQMLAASALRWSFARSSGPGGQNVNKVNTQATLTVSLEAIREVLPPAPYARFLQIASRYINAEDELVISCSETRSQLDNRAGAVERLQTLVTSARRRPRIRKPTRPTKASKERRIKAKKQRGEIKSQRRGIE